MHSTVHGVANAAVYGLSPTSCYFQAMTSMLVMTLVVVSDRICLGKKGNALTLLTNLQESRNGADFRGD